MKEKFARWHTLVGLYLKRDWKIMLVWILGLSLFAAGYVPAFQEIAKGQGLLGLYETMQNPAMTAIVGPTPIETAQEYTIGAMYAHEMLLFCGLFAMIISALYVVKHTRKEEEQGLTELVRSFSVGRQANSLAIIVEAMLIHLLLALLTAGVMISFDADTITVEGSLLFGISIGMAGLMGAGIALLTAQIMPTSSAATGSALAIIGLLYLVRAGTDLYDVNLSMLNPMGWIYLTYPFTENHWFPLVVALIFIAVLLLLAFGLEGKRDLGAGYLPPREGRERAKRSLLSVHGLLFRLSRGMIISWLIAYALLGAAYGSLYGDMQSFLESSEIMQQMFLQQGVTIEESFTGTVTVILISLVAILPIAIVNKLFAEETSMRFSQLFATQVTRGQLYWTCMGLAVFSSIVGILFASGGLGIAAVAVMDKHSTMTWVDFLIISYHYLPSVLFFLGLAAVALGWVPRWGKVVYVYLGYAFILTYLQELLDLPEWFIKTAIQNWLPQVPIEEFELSSFIGITVLSIALILIGYWGYRRRDLLEGA